MPKYSDIATGCFLLMISIIMFISSFGIKKIPGVVMGSDAMPRVGALLLFVFAVILFIQSRRNLKTITAGSSEENTLDETGKSNKAWLALGILFFYILLLYKIGFIITSAVAIFALEVLLAPTKKCNYKLFAVVGIVSSVLIYYIFVNVFKLMLPAGILG